MKRLKLLLLAALTAAAATAQSKFTYEAEPTEVTDLNITFTTPIVTTDYVKEGGFVDILLKSDDTDADGNHYEARLYLMTDQEKPAADFYPINASRAKGTFLYSYGRNNETGSDYPCVLHTVATEDGKSVFTNTWYICAGYITLGYDYNGNMKLEGNVATYRGTNIRFLAADPAGISSVTLDAATAEGAKTLRDGNITVRRADATYNTLGQRLK